MQPRMDAAQALARRLRDLRLNGLTRPVTQKQLGDALGCSVATISSWENPQTPALPSDDWLRRYAVFFTTSRSLAPEPRLLAKDELTGDERARRDELEEELLALRAARVAESATTTDAEPAVPDFWVYPPGERVTIVCAELPEHLRRQMKPYTDPNDPDYIDLYTYADVDSLMQLYGHIRAVNPRSVVNYKRDTEVTARDYASHLVLLGGVDWNDTTRLVMEQLAVARETRGMPVRQSTRPEDDADGWFSVGERTYTPEVVKSGTEKRLLSDVAHFFRGPSPMGKGRTVTICNGMYGRGTLGAARALTWDEYRDANGDYIRKRFGGSSLFSILCRVRILGGEVVPPDWNDPAVRLHEWPD